MKKKKSENKLQLELTNKKNGIFKNFKNSKMTQNMPRNKNKINLKNHVRWPQMQTSSENKLQLELTNIENDFFQQKNRN